MDRKAFGQEFYAWVQQSTIAAAASPDVRAQEPALLGIVNLVRSNPDNQDQAEQLLIDLVARLSEVPPPWGLLELLEYCVHALDMPGVLTVAAELREQALGALSEGESLRPWEVARRLEQVIAAADLGWDGREIFPSLAT